MNQSSNKDEHTQLEQIPRWNLVDEIWIKRKFKFKDFVEAMKFVNLVADHAEKERHHPFISIHYNVVILKLTSLEEKSLTIKDIEMAKQFDVSYKKVQ